MAGGGSPLASLAREISLQGHELLFQREAERVARARAPEKARHIAECVEGADRRLRLVGGVSEREVALATATLLRDAVILLLDAESTVREREAPGEGAGAELGRVCEALGIPASTCDEARRLLAATDPLALDEIPPDDLARSVRAMERIVGSLRPHVDARSVEGIVLSRWRRVGVTAVFVAGLVFFGIRALVTPPNVARGKPVTLSSADPRGAPESALVDGVRSGDTAPGTPRPDVVQTHREMAPWALIDLQKPYAVREIRVYNRDDGYFDEGLPYVVEVSVDGVKYTEVGLRTTHFGSWWVDPPWVLRLPKVPARFVRVRATNYLALSEVEVFAW